MLYFFLYYLPEKIIGFISAHFNLILPETMPMKIVIYGIIGLVLLIVTILMLVLLFKLAKFLWRRWIKRTSLGKVIEEKIMLVLWDVDWKLVLMVFFCCEVLMEYWNIFLPITVGFEARDFINTIYNFFFDTPNSGLKSLVIMLIYYSVSIIFYFLLPLLFLFGRQIITKDKYYLKYTFNPGNWKIGLGMTLICWVFMLIVLFIVMPLSKDLRELYPLGGNKALLNNPELFIIFELGALIYFIAFEYFFRGLYSSSWKKK